MTSIFSDKLLSDARKMAMKAAPFEVLHDGNTYTAVFNMNEYVYDTYENGVEFIKINMKSKAKAKRFLIDYLNS